MTITHTLASIFSFAAAWAAVGWLSGPGARLNLLDHPSERSLHARPTPRSGGLGVWIAVAVGVGLVAEILPAAMWPLIIGAVALAAVSLADDLLEVSPLARLAVHAGAAAAVLPAGIVADRVLPLVGALPGPVAAGISILAVIWMINLYNFMDGMDGFAGGMAVIGFGSFALLGTLAGHTPFVLASLILAAAAGGFLAWNFPPARIFLGDVGSTLFGYAAAALTLWAQHDGVFPVWIGLMVFFPFVADATVTLARRALRGEPVWKPHRSHYYQRLVLLGWGHRRTVLVEYAVMLACALAAVGTRLLGEMAQALALGGMCVAAALLMRAVARLERSRAA